LAEGFRFYRAAGFMEIKGLADPRGAKARVVPTYPLF
jgi:hypothetical protein